MIEQGQLNGESFVLNSNLIESIENIPETKILLTTGKYYLVLESREEIVKKIIAFQRKIFQHSICLNGGKPQE